MQKSPPIIGDLEHFSACWWVQEQAAEHQFTKAQT
jgi:hypothetical protein